MIHRFLILAAALLLGLSASPALASKAQVVDNAGFFSQPAVDQANQRLSELDDKYAKQMRVETFPEIPADMRGNYREANKRQFFQDWARKLAEQEKITGVFVLICKNPSSLQVEVGGSTLRSGTITQTDRTAISNALLNSFKPKNYDEGLAKGIDAFSAGLAAHAGAKTPAEAAPSAVSRSDAAGSTALPAPSTPSAPSASSSPPAPYSFPTASPPARSTSYGGIIFLVAVIVIGFWIIRKLFGIGSSANRQGYGQGTSYGAGGYQPGYGSGGGGFGRGIGGGILGGLLGSWVGNRMFDQHHDASNPSSPPTNPGNTGGSFNEAPPSDFSSGGGSASGGGGDFGGSSDSSGGGGSDFSGGGGGDASSGGGDF